MLFGLDDKVRDILMMTDSSVIYLGISLILQQPPTGM